MRLLRFVDVSGDYWGCNREMLNSVVHTGDYYARLTFTDGHLDVRLDPDHGPDISFAMLMNWIENDNPNPLVWDFPKMEE